MACMTIPSRWVDYITLEANNISTGKTPEDALQEGRFVDSHVGLNVGHTQKRPSDSLDYYPVHYKGNYEWSVCTAACVDDDWKGVESWNEATSLVFGPEEIASFGHRFVVVSSVADVESAATNPGLHVSVRIPGYVILEGTVESLYLNASSEPSLMEVSPANILKLSNLPPAPTAPRF
ncbi:hypothetical protein BGW36DRAFT_432522 [Talaromyces proteolyticus]|uniref:Uncharacterized protein n=1 Tax=Talaromyces proteolyticus TaxID=1131652 RepID=A0AAD4KFG9_9EURO|nr:uncharacterized protein BGW36DRAFT_432522 [Talaromyces proteolyticus]KAH8690732.1 hypothetical protein BGW36DRAFT_432522 [Talaromyces proteolyticus]